ncbi:hypothetical protein BDQ12DRAFT_719620 [Crucibulum laeve]|uniref:Glutathione S-transferase n=1 Tax=Crucibulum laeve TaxID=68775 RepID=A0A5C3MCZ1_9AGAR|nr:hypothetical protein BDQ12DRAFT_719620 [Crucibulum laeve]
MSSAPYTVVGTPFSTFTRTITMGLQHKGLKYEQIATTPHSEIAQQYHPLGFLPTLVIHEVDGKPVDLKLFESQAIVRFIDRIAPEPSLHATSGVDGIPLEEKMWEFVSLTAFFGFPTVEGGVVKPRVKAIDEGKLSDAEVRVQIKDGVSKLREYLTLMESLMSPDGFAFGDHPTWADFFLFPLLADLRMVPEWDSDAVGDRIKKWIKRMDELPAVKATAAGTLSVGARP